MNKANKPFTDFAETRKAGAQKIVDTAKEKGGLALLTWHHFKVKLPYYKKAEAGKFDLREAEKEFKETYKKISSSMSQIDFQTEVGRLEVLGELIIKEKTNGSRKIKESKVLNYEDFLTESRLSVGRMNENYENSLYSDIMDLIHNSNSSHEEIVDVLNSIVDEMSSSRRIRKDTEDRFRNRL